MATAMMSDFELTRQKRIEDNQRRMAEMGLSAMAAHILRRAEPVPAPPVRPPTQWPTQQGERRAVCVSARSGSPSAHRSDSTVGRVYALCESSRGGSSRALDLRNHWGGGRRVANFAARRTRSVLRQPRARLSGCTGTAGEDAQRWARRVRRAHPAAGGRERGASSRARGE